MRSLEAVQLQSRWLALPIAMLAAWALWLLGSHVDVYAASGNARFEVLQKATRVAAPKGGRIVSLALELGREVHEGDVLATLDDTSERRHRAELESELHGVESRIAAVREQIAVEEQARGASERVKQIEGVRARLAAREAESAADHQARLTDVTARLHERGIVATIELQKAEQEAGARRSQAQGAVQEIGRLQALRDLERDSALARIAGMRTQEVELASRLETLRLQLAEADADVEHCLIRASAPGRLATAAPVRIGDVLKEGDLIATVVPSEEASIVGEFPAADAVGRILPGQRARVRLSGFAWTEYGALGATVRRVATEPSLGAIRVELQVDDAALGGVPLQHGLPAAVEIHVETATPWQLLVRMVGRALTTPPPQAAS
jgi:membrane fusion protein (multidrug efflux system)